MKVLLVDNHSKHKDEILSLFSDDVIVETQEQLGPLDDLLYDLIIFSGGSDTPSVLYNPESYEKEFELIERTSTPILGICLGNEIITKSFGGTLQDFGKVNRGEVSIEIIDNNLKEIIKENPFAVYEAHEVGIKNMPNDFVICGKSKHGPEIIKHSTKPIIGIQFHPEVEANKLLWQWIFENLTVKK